LSGAERDTQDSYFPLYISTQAAKCSPSLIILDDLDVLLPSESTDEQTTWLCELLASKVLHARQQLEDLQAEMNAQVTNGLANRAGFAWNQGAIAWLATGRNKQSIHASLLKCGLFDFAVELPPLSPAARGLVFQAIARQAGVVLESDVDDVNCEGFAPADFQNLIDRARIEASIRLGRGHPSIAISRSDVDAALKDLVPVSLRGAKLLKSQVQVGFFPSSSSLSCFLFSARKNISSQSNNNNIKYENNAVV